MLELKNREVLTKLIDAVALDHDHKLQDLGIEIGKLYTDRGLPVDIALDRLKQYSEIQKLAIIHGVCRWLMAHKRNSGAGDKSIDRQMIANNKMIHDFLSKGEVGVY